MLWIPTIFHRISVAAHTYYQFITWVLKCTLYILTKFHILLCKTEIQKYLLYQTSSWETFTASGLYTLQIYNYQIFHCCTLLHISPFLEVFFNIMTNNTTYFFEIYAKNVWVVYKSRNHITISVKRAISMWKNLHQIVNEYGMSVILTDLLY